MANANERVDRLIRHQIGLLRVGDNVARQIISILNHAEAGIVAKLVDLDPNEVTRSKYRQERLERLLEAVRDINTGVYRQMRGELNSELKPIAAAEIEFQDRLLRAGTNLRIGLPTVETAYAAALARPFQGRLLKEMYAGIEAGAKERLRNAIRMGFVEGESVSDVVRRIRGTRSSGYRDGILEINRKDAYRVARTAVSHTAAVARQAVYEANADIAQGVIWTSVLDTRTSPICAARSQKAYTPAGKPIGHNLAWLGGPGRAHFNCRSTGVLWLKDEEKPEGLSYQKWLERQSVDVQDNILGPQKAALFRTGELPLDRFVEKKGGTLTLEQLKAQEAKAFDKAGLSNPIKPPRGVPQDEIALFLRDKEAQQSLLTKLMGATASHRDVVRRVKKEEKWKATEESLLGIRHYTGFGYKHFNQRLRDNESLLEDRQLSALIADGVRELPDFKESVYRAPARRVDYADRLWDNARNGEFLDFGKTPQSYSRMRSFAEEWSGGTNLLVEIKKPKVGAYIEKISVNPGEEEVLFPEGLRYRIAGKRTDGAMRIIEVEIVDE